MFSPRFTAPAAVLVLAACSSTSDFKVTDLITPFRIDVRQGNYVDQDMVAQLKPGQTREQVRYLLGTPLMADPFHADRWDYVYRFQPGKGEAQERRLAVFFQDGKLARISGDVVAQEPGQQETAAILPARVVDIPADPDSDKGAKDAPAPGKKHWYWPF
ncbi:MAG: outer membrane protein assembly factor BamE [Proteobacteria bacterium]|nr:outer membrane protein assembly factor BamE [Pseudomonadota bacterium]HQR02930.1 outer membrane protein assembly factor BamE [Rhodocyclaceae bacterium]